MILSSHHPTALNQPNKPISLSGVPVLGLTGSRLPQYDMFPSLQGHMCMPSRFWGYTCGAVKLERLVNGYVIASEIKNRIISYSFLTREHVHMRAH